MKQKKTFKNLTSQLADMQNKLNQMSKQSFQSRYPGYNPRPYYNNRNQRTGNQVKGQIEGTIQSTGSHQPTKSDGTKHGSKDSRDEQN